jgi:biopolymer transport protein ExbB
MYLAYLYFLGRAKRLAHRIERAGIEMVNLISDAREEGAIVSFREEVEARRRTKRQDKQEGAS